VRECVSVLDRACELGRVGAMAGGRVCVSLSMSVADCAHRPHRAQDAVIYCGLQLASIHFSEFAKVNACE